MQRLLLKEQAKVMKQVQRFIRLTNLIPELLDMVDEKKIAFNPAVELSYLDESQQRDFLEAMQRHPECAVPFPSAAAQKAGAGRALLV